MRAKGLHKYSEAPTFFRAYEPFVRCNACGSAATDGAWCSSPGCVTERARYERELGAFAARYPEIEDRLAAILRGEAPAFEHVIPEELRRPQHRDERKVA